MGGSTMLDGGATKVARSGRRSGKWLGGERWWCHDVNRRIVDGVALGRRGGFAPKVFASNHGCLEGFDGLENRRNGFLEHALREYSLLDPSTFDLPYLSSSILVKKIGVNIPHPGGVGQRPSDA
ncbi:unnamed protein product [Prunus armeniaca]